MKFIILSLVLSLHPLLEGDRSFKMTSPAGSYQTLFEWEEDGLFHCFIYKLPLKTLKKSHKGSLFILKSSERGCPLGKGERQKLYQNISTLEVINIERSKGMTFQIVVDDQDPIDIELPFPSREKSRWVSLYPYGPDTNKGKDSSFAIKEGDFCLERDRDCQVVGKNQCSLCKGWSPTIDLQCSTQVSGLCGGQSCGGRDQRACLKILPKVKINDCNNMKNYTFCQYGLETICKANGEVICR